MTDVTYTNDTCRIGKVNTQRIVTLCIDDLMSSEPGARLRRARLDAGFQSAQAAADAYGWAIAAYRHHENGTRGFDFATAQRYGRAFKVQAAWLLGEGSSTQSATDGSQEKADTEVDNVAIQQWDVAYGMGGGTYLDLPVTGDMHTFSRSWLRQFTHAAPDKIFLATGTGDSMSATILDADIVLIDTSQREVRLADKIWAAAYGQTGIIKRLRPMPDGSVKILSDNPAVPPETAYDGELNVVGRVVAIVRKM